MRMRMRMQNALFYSHYPHTFPPLISPHHAVTQLTDAHAQFEVDMHARHQDLMYELVRLRKEMHERHAKDLSTSGGAGVAAADSAKNRVLPLRTAAERARWRHDEETSDEGAPVATPHTVAEAIMSHAEAIGTRSPPSTPRVRPLSLSRKSSKPPTLKLPRSNAVR